MKKLIAILLAAVMVFSLIACSSDEETRADNQSGSSAESGSDAANSQNTETIDDAKALPQVALKDLPATRLSPVPSAKCQSTDGFNGAEIANQIAISYVGFIRGQWSNEDVFVFDNPTDYYVSLELRMYPLENGQRGKSYSRLTTTMLPQTTVLITSASLGYTHNESDYDMELTVNEVAPQDRIENVREWISYGCADAGANTAALKVKNNSNRALYVSFITLLLKDGEVVYLDASRKISQDDTSDNLASGQSGIAEIVAPTAFDSFAVSFFTEPG